MNNVKLTREKGLCCSCGICAGVCSRGCIRFEREQGMFVPIIDEYTCVNCGLCSKSCPGQQISYSNDSGFVSIKNAIRGSVIKSCVTWSKNPDLRHRGASGGTIISLIHALLEKGAYDGAFCVSSYQYSEQVKAVLINSCSELYNCSKSRYVPVSHEETVRYMRANPEKRLIIVGTPCAISGLHKVIDLFHLNRENYLFLGLFCERLFQYNIFDYFASLPESQGKILDKMHFKNKESGGWPGNIKLMFTDGSYSYLDASYRTSMKDYFQPERCLYCIDKLNVFADISCGDNYTQCNNSPLGSNSTIIRTERGLNAFQLAEERLVVHESSIEEIEEAQATSIRGMNCLRPKAKENNINYGVTTEGLSVFRENTVYSKLRIGQKYLEDPDVLGKDIAKQKSINNIKMIVSFPLRIVTRIKRIIIRGR